MQSDISQVTSQLEESENTISAIENEYKQILNEKGNLEKRYREKKECLDKIIKEFDIMKVNHDQSEADVKDRDSKIELLEIERFELA